MTIDKKAKVALETTANYQPLSTLDVQFYNRDINTAVLNFIVTRNKEPLLLGPDNVETNIMLVAEDNSKIRDELTIKDGMNGIVAFTLPKEFLQHTGKVTGQVEIAVKGKEDTVVERLFSFNIVESLIESFNAETKLVYIKRFDDLEARIDNKMAKIEEAMANGADYVAEIEKAKETGLSDIAIAKSDSLKELTKLAKEHIENIDEKGSNYVKKLTGVRDSIDDKITQFNEDVQSEGFVKKDDTENYQKYAFTSENGQRKWLGALEQKIETLPAGLYEASIPYDNESVGVPKEPNGDAYLAAFDIFEGDAGRKQIYFTQNFHNRHFIKTLHSNGSDQGWREVVTVENISDIETTVGSNKKIEDAKNGIKDFVNEKLYDTGWQNLPLMSGFEPDNSFGPSVYRIKNDICMVIFNAKITSDILSSGSPMFSLPSNYSPEYAFSFLARTNGNANKNPIKCSYDVINKVFKVWENNTNTATIDDYVYGQLTFIVG